MIDEFDEIDYGECENHLLNRHYEDGPNIFEVVYECDACGETLFISKHYGRHTPRPLDSNEIMSIFMKVHGQGFFKKK